MGTLRIAPGQRTNYLALGTVTLSLAEDPNFPKARMWDFRTNRPFQFVSNLANPAIDVDNNRVLNPGLETWASGVPANWTKVGTVVETTVAAEVRTGSAAKVSTGSYLQQDLTLKIRAGELLKADIWARISAAGAIAALHIINPFTDKYLTSAGAWSATPQATTNTTSTSYVNLTRTFSAEAYATLINSDLTTLRLRLAHDGGSEFAFFDDVTLYPGVDCIAVMGHNLDPKIVFQLLSSPDGSAFTSRGTGVIASPTFYVRLTDPLYFRHWRAAFNGGSNSSAIRMTELFLTQLSQPTQQYEIPRVGESRLYHLSATTPGGERHIHKISEFESRRRVLRYTFSGTGAQAAHDNAKELFYLRPSGEAHPALVIPDIDRPEVFLARLLSTWPHVDHQSDYITDVMVEVQEMPFAPKQSL